MGFISLEKSDSLYWLGRYTERVFTSLELSFDYYDKMLDQDPKAFKKFTEKLGMSFENEEGLPLFAEFLYKRENIHSICACMNFAYDNGITLREEIGSESLAYIQLALDQLKATKTYDEKYRQLLKVLDTLYAFWGCLDDKMIDEENRNLVKAGRYVERVDMLLRAGKYEELPKEVTKMIHRVKHTGRAYNAEKLSKIQELFDGKSEEEIEKGTQEALNLVNSLLL